MSERSSPVAPATTAPGARALAAEQERLLACVHCGFCLSSCPTYTRLGDENDSPRGRLYLMRAVVEGRLDPADDAFRTHIDRCLGCRACEPVCPSGVEYGYLLERARAASAEAVRGSRAGRLLLRTFGSPRLAALVSAGGRILRAGGIAAWLAARLPRRFHAIRFGLAMLAATRGWSGLRVVPARPEPVGGAKLDRAGDAGRDDVAWKTAGRLRVALLAGCVQSGLFARVNHATERVLRANGCTLLPVPGQGCCGALHAHGGALEEAKRLARHNIAAFERAGADVIVVNAAGCGAAMKEYGEQLHDDEDWRERAAAFSARVRDISEFLVELGPRRGAPLPLRVTYDAPCHLHHAQRITDAPQATLAAVPGLELVPLTGADECCGGAGIYGLLHPELGGRILDDKVDAILATGADAVVTPNPGCMMQIGAGLILRGRPLPVLHPVEVLDESYRRALREEASG